MKRMIGLIMALMCLIHPALAEDGAWTDDAWATVAAALASDDPCPVPRQYRIKCSPGQTGAVSGLDGAWMNMLLLSTDAPEISDNFGRTDVVLLCAVNVKTGAARLISLPEECLCAVEGLPRPIQLRYVNCFGGPLLTVKAVNDLLGLNISRYCAVNFDSFITAMDALSGVTLQLTEGEAAALEMEPGEGRLSGEQALRYVRLRQQGDGSQRARKLMETVLEQLLNKASLDEDFSLMERLLPALDTNLTTENLMDILFAVVGSEAPMDFSTTALTAVSGALSPEAAARCRGFIYGE